MPCVKSPRSTCRPTLVSSRAQSRKLATEKSRGFPVPAKMVLACLRKALQARAAKPREFPFPEMQVLVYSICEIHGKYFSENEAMNALERFT